MAGDQLTAKEAAFVEEFLKDRNASAAAVRAGYSSRTANRIGHELRQRPRVAAAIALAIEERSIRNRVTSDQVLQELARLAFSDLRNVVRWSDRRGLELLDSAELDEDAAAAVREVKETKEGLGIKLHDKLGALKLLGEHLGLFEGDTGKKGGGLSDALRLARERRAKRDGSAGGGS